MNDNELLESLKNTAYTTGAGANCFFQAFIHTLCYQNAEVIDRMNYFPGPKKLIELFNRAAPEIQVSNMKELIVVANAMHPLEREIIFGHLMRDTLNALNLKGANNITLELDRKSIIFPQHAAAFAHAFGFSFDEYTEKNEGDKIPELPKKDLFGGEFYRVRYSREGAVGTLSLRLKSCHFEVGGLTPEQVASHQNKINDLTLKDNEKANRPELPGARYYKEPKPDSDCAVGSDEVNFDDALKLTIAALKNRPGEHNQLFVKEAPTQTRRPGF